MLLSSTLLTTSHHQQNKRASRSDLAYQTIKDQIVTLELPPASLINEASLIEKLGIGRTPIREALQRLARENLVIILPRRGTIVADLNMSDLQKIFEVRRELEVFCVKLVAERSTPEELEAMMDFFAENEPLVAQATPRQLIRIDYQAHQMLAEAARNEFLAENLQWLYTHVLRLWHVLLDNVSILPQGIEDHRLIVKALQAGNTDEACDLMRAHVSNFQNHISVI